MVDGGGGCEWVVGWVVVVSGRRVSGWANVGSLVGLSWVGWSWVSEWVGE